MNPRAFVVFLLCQLTLCLGACQNLNTSSLCNFMDYDIVSINDTGCEDIPEAFIKNTSLLWYLVSPSCRLALGAFFCSQAFPPCVSNTSLLPCDSVCHELNNSCDLNDQLLIQEFYQIIPYNQYEWNCSLFPSVNCYSPSGVDPPSTPTCGNYTGDTCAGVVNYEVYQEIGFDQSKVEQTISLIKIVANPSLSGNCSSLVLQYACAQAYPRCNRHAISTSINQSLLYQPPLPSYPCRSLCEEYSKCTNVHAIDPRLVPNCNSKGYLDFWQGNQSICGTLKIGFPDWPEDQTSYGTVLGGEVSTQCHFSQAIEINGTCPWPLVYVEPSYVGFFRRRFPHSPCEVVCPFYPLWKQSEWDTAQGLMYMCIPSFICTTFLLATWLIFPSKRKQYYILNFSIAAWLISLVNVFAFAAVDDPSELRTIGCSPNGGYRSITRNGGFCVFQAFVNFCLMLTCVAWWLIISFDIFLKVVLEYRLTMQQERRKDLYYTCFGWGFPILSVSIFLMARGGLGGTPSLLFCWSTTSFDSAQSELEFVFFFGPIGVFLGFGAAFIFAVIYSFRKAAKAVGKSQGTTESIIARSIRPAIFVFSFLFIYVWIFWFRLAFHFTQNEIEVKVSNWLRCILENGSSDNYFDICGNTPGDLFKVSPWYALHWAHASQGTVQFLIWGLMKSNWDLWTNLIQGKTTRFSKKASSTGPPPMSPSQKLQRQATGELVGRISEVELEHLTSSTPNPSSSVFNFSASTPSASTTTIATPSLVSANLSDRVPPTDPEPIEA